MEKSERMRVADCCEVSCRHTLPFLCRVQRNISNALDDAAAVQVSAVVAKDVQGLFRRRTGCVIRRGGGSPVTAGSN